jgi:phosphoglycerol transferase MdoB-like AlkP superfamily enzyme
LRKTFENVPASSDSPFRISPKTGKQPNVVLILSESFWDVPQMKNVRFDPDPIPNFRSISSTFGGGRLISPTFGGKTALVEFEILTGNSMALLPKGSVPYQQYLKNPIPSVVWEFKKNGYETVAVHTYEKTFFNRANAYPLLGFDAFIGKEDLSHPKYRGRSFLTKRLPTKSSRDYGRKTERGRCSFSAFRWRTTSRTKGISSTTSTFRYREAD